jgi:hypothetical protein
MKKSLAYKLAQFAVLRDKDLHDTEKLQVLRVLIDAEDLARFTEQEEEKRNAE